VSLFVGSFSVIIRIEKYFECLAGMWGAFLLGEKEMEGLKREYLGSLGEINRRIEEVERGIIKRGYREGDLTRLNLLLKSRDDLVFAICEMSRD